MVKHLSHTAQWICSKNKSNLKPDQAKPPSPTEMVRNVTDAIGVMMYAASSMNTVWDKNAVQVIILRTFVVENENLGWVWERRASAMCPPLCTTIAITKYGKADRNPAWSRLKPKTSTKKNNSARYRKLYCRKAAARNLVQ